MASVLLPICGAIWSFKYVIARIKRNGLKGVDSQIDIAILRANLNLDCSFHYELNLSKIDPITNRMQMTPNIVKIWDQNLCDPDSNIQCIFEGGNMRSFALPQGRYQILPRPGRNINRNLP